MRTIVWMPAACAAFLLAGCDEIATTGQSGQAGFLSPVPEAVAAMAAPYQDLNAVRIEPSTGCFVYRHAGPVETTMLPLRTDDGRPICTVASGAPTS